MAQEAHHVDFFTDKNRNHTHKDPAEIVTAINDILKRGRVVANFSLERTIPAGHDALGKIATGHIFIIETPEPGSEHAFAQETDEVLNGSKSLEPDPL